MGILKIIQGFSLQVLIMKLMALLLIIIIHMESDWTDSQQLVVLTKL